MMSLLLKLLQLIQIMYQFNIPGHFAPIADFELITKAKQVADDIGAVTHVGNILSSDTFYNADKHFNDSWKNMVS